MDAFATHRLRNSLVLFPLRCSCSWTVLHLLLRDTLVSGVGCVPLTGRDSDLCVQDNPRPLLRAIANGTWCRHRCTLTSLIDLLALAVRSVDFLEELVSSLVEESI